MSIESEIFKRYTPDRKKLLSYGFSKNKSGLEVQKLIKDGEFKAFVQVSDKGEVSGRVYDAESDEEFLPLRVEDGGAFVGAVREEYSKLLTEIRDNCFCENYFVAPQSNRLSEMIYEKFGDRPVFMWKEYPTFGVYKNQESGKWYGLIMYLQRSKLQSGLAGATDVLNVKIDKDKIPDLVKNNGYYPAYHMNKKYWITITLDETLSDNEIFSLIEESYSYTVPKSRKK